MEVKGKTSYAISKCNSNCLEVISAVVFIKRPNIFIESFMLIFKLQTRIFFHFNCRFHDKNEAHAYEVHIPSFVHLFLALPTSLRTCFNSAVLQNQLFNFLFT